MEVLYFRDYLKEIENIDSEEFGYYDEEVTEPFYKRYEKYCYKHYYQVRY